MLAQQVQFWDDDNKEWFGGIMIDNEYIICGCCGSVYECNELKKKKIIPYDAWINISDEILGDQGLTKILNRCIMILE